MNTSKSDEIFVNITTYNEFNEDKPTSQRKMSPKMGLQ